MRLLVTLLVLAAGCVSDRPAHPHRLEGFPGAPIEEGLFPLRDGARWTFADQDGKTLVLSIGEREGKFVLRGQTPREAEIREQDDYLEVLYEGNEGKLLDRPLKLKGAVGDQWRAAGASYMIYGYEEIEVLGKKVRALVVAADRKDVRDLCWFAKDLGWVRFKTERTGKTLRDARLVSFEQ